MTAAQRRVGAILAALALASVSASFAQTIPIPIQSQLPGFLGAPRADTAWVLTVTVLVGAVTTPIAGRLGDLFGRKRVLLGLLGSLVAGSIVCAVSTTIVPMVVGRALAGLAMGTMPLALGILRAAAPPERIGRVISMMVATVGIGAALGLPVSAFIAERLDWHLLFVIDAVLALGAITLLLVLVPGSAPTPGVRVDVVGGIWLAAALVAGLLAISRGNEWGWLSPATLGLAIGGILALVGWGAFELRMRDPLVDLRVAAQPAVLFTNLSTISLGFTFFASSVVFPQLLQGPPGSGGLGLTLQQASLVQMSLGVSILVVSPVAGWLASRIGPRRVLLIGVGCLVVAYGAAVLLTNVGIAIWHVAVVQALVGAGIGCGMSSMPAIIFRVVAPSASSAAAGLNQLMQSLGSTLAAALVAAVLAAAVLPGSTVPSIGGFAGALGLGLGAAVLCGLVALVIPAPQEGTYPVTR